MLLSCLSSGCWYFMWVSGSSNSPHPVCAWSVPIWNISEKKEIQRTRAGMYIPHAHPFKDLIFYNTFIILIFSRWCLLRCHVTQSWISIFKIHSTAWSHSLRRFDNTRCGWFGETILHHYVIYFSSTSFSQNEAEKVVVVIMDKEHHPVERFVFEISQPTLLSIRCVFNYYCASFCD